MTSANNYWSKAFRQRVQRRRVLGAMGAGSLGAALLAACGPDNNSSGDKTSLVSQISDTSKQAKRGGVIKWFSASDVPSLDPAITSSPLQSVQSQVLDYLLEDMDQSPTRPEPQIGPGLAESWEWSSDGLQLTMKLRQGVKWHNKPPVNGRAFDIDDVMATFSRFSTKSSNRSAMLNSINPNAPVLSLTASDSRTIVVKLKEPVAYVMGMISYSSSGGFPMLPKETDSTFDPRSDLLGTSGYVFSDYSPSVGWKFNRNAEYVEKDGKDVPYANQIEVPIVLEYAQGLAQLKAHNLHSYIVRPEDVLATKQGTPDLKMYHVDPVVNFQSGRKTIFGWSPTDANKPFKDERVRQAYSMSIDRDLWIDTFYNVSSFEAAGLPLETWWHTPLTRVKGWWLDPKSKDFGPNAKYFQHDVAEAKKLLAAAGYPNGIDIDFAVVQGAELGGELTRKQLDVEGGMVSEAGLRVKFKFVDYSKEYIPTYRDGLGKFEGMGFQTGAPAAQDPTFIMAWNYHSKRGGVNFFGFDANGRGDGSGDPQLDTMIQKAGAELDTERRRAMVFDIQRYIAGKMYAVHGEGATTEYQLAWPELANFGVFKSIAKRPLWRLWIDS